MAISTCLKLCGNQKDADTSEKSQQAYERYIMVITGGTEIAVLDGEPDALDRLTESVVKKVKEYDEKASVRIEWLYRGKYAFMYHLGNIYSRRLAIEAVRKLKYIFNEKNLNFLIIDEDISPKDNIGIIRKRATAG